MVDFFDIVMREWGSRGTSQGGGGLNYSVDPPRPQIDPGYRPKEVVSKFLLIWVSFFDRFGVGFGSVLGVVFGLFGALVGPSWSQSPLRTDISSKNITLDLARW